jgi:peptidyl-prolyl cis-trans isomerase SurA
MKAYLQKKSARLICVLNALAGSVLLIGTSVFAQPQSIALDRVVAIVDEDVVLESEFNDRKAAILERLKGQYKQLPPEDILNKQILEQLIIERIELGLAKRYEIEVDESEIDEAVNRILQKNNMTLQQLEASLLQQGITIAGLRKQLRNDITINNLQQGVVNSRIKINDRDIENFLASTDGKFATSADYHIGHILISVASDASEAEVAESEKLANSIYKQLNDGADFAQMAITHSKDQAALNGGDIGWRKLAQLPELFADQMNNLPQGKVTKPFRSGAGFHILKNIEQSGGGAQIVEQTHARHILIKTSEIMDDRQAREKLLQLSELINRGEDFAKLAREHSEDPGSMMSGGDLGWSMPGMFVKQFEDALKNTDIGKISRPFKSEFGWHIVQVLERRKEDMSDKMKRNQAANALRSRRYDEEFQLWLAQIREEAYVEIKL